MAKNPKGTNGNDTLEGTSLRDVINGLSGDDILIGLGGNDIIHGGQGIDTAIFSGNYGDYDISARGRGRDDGKPLPNAFDVVGPDGTDSLNSVEFLKFNDGVFNTQSGDLWQYSKDSVDPSAQDPSSPGTLIAGSGIPASDFGLARNEDAGIELGLQVIYRQGPTVPTADTYADGVLSFSVADGPQSTLNGSGSNNATRAAWNFEYSIATGLNGETTDFDDFVFKLLVDVDASEGTNYRTLILESGGTGGSGLQWRDQDSGLVPIADDDGNSNVTQNSQNYAFYAGLLGGDYQPTAFAGPAEFDIQLQTFDLTNQLIAQNHISVEVS